MENIAWEHLSPIQRVQLLHYRPDLKENKTLVECLFCDEQFWVEHNVYQCEKCGKRGNVRNMPMVRLDGSVK